MEEAPTPAEPAPVEAVPQGPGTVTIEASVRGNPVSCDVQLLSDAGDEVARVRPEIDALTDRLVEGARELERLGAEFKGVELGLVDFPTLRDGQLAYLCWQYGEDRIRFWHSVETGYAGRRLLVDD